MLLKMWDWLTTRSEWWVPLIVTLAVLWSLCCMVLTSCAAPQAVQLPQSEPRATGAFNVAQSSQDTSQAQPTGIASPAVPVKADKVGEINPGAASGGGPWLTIVAGIAIGILGLVLWRLLGLVTGAVKASPVDAALEVKNKVVENAGPILKYLLDLYLAATGKYDVR